MQCFAKPHNQNVGRVVSSHISRKLPRRAASTYTKLDRFANVEWVLKYRSIFQSRMHHAVIGLLFCGDMLFGFNLTSLIPFLSLKQWAQRNASSSSGLWLTVELLLLHDDYRLMPVR